MTSLTSEITRESNTIVRDATNGERQTPLHFARSIEKARLLIEHGADVDAANASSLSPLRVSTASI